MVVEATINNSIIDLNDFVMDPSTWKFIQFYHHHITCIIFLSPKKSLGYDLIL